MCGICGVHPFGGGPPATAEILASMLESITHRGPDDEGVHLEPDIGLGSHRLSIIDLPGGRQPIHNEDRSVTVVFNGELYNYRELRALLQRRGHTFATDSDTEVIAHLYEEAGEECLLDMRGMFAFALWDSRCKRLLLARDRLGIKPLYYAQRRGSLVFASEIKALLQHPAVEAVPDFEGLGQFLALKYVPAPRTMFEGIHALPPGHLLVCDRDGPRVRRYWRLSFAGRAEATRSMASYEEELVTLLRESVQLHLTSDVPFGAFLSGGIDSSTVVALMTERLHAPVRTFSVGYDGEGEAQSELQYARLVARQHATEHHEILVRGRDLVELSDKVVWHLDQPIADPATLANYKVAELARRHVKMVLTGEGGDELFGGYARHAGDQFSPLFQRVPHTAKAAAMAVLERIPRLDRPRLALRALCQPDEVSRLVNWFPLFNAEMRAALMTDELKAAADGGWAEQAFAACLAETDATDPLNRMLYLDTSLWLPDDLLARGDKMSMAASLEARVPLLDHKVVEFAATLPPHLKVNGLARKVLLKRVAQRWLPAQIIRRKKAGFPVPLSAWFRGEARTFVRDILSPSAIRTRGLFEPRYVQSLIDRNERDRVDGGPFLWALLNVELWFRTFIDNRAGSRAGLRVQRGGDRPLESQACVA